MIPHLKEFIKLLERVYMIRPDISQDYKTTGIIIIVGHLSNQDSILIRMTISLHVATIISSSGFLPIIREMA